VARRLDERGFSDVAEAIVGMQRQRVSADYLQTAAVIEPDWTVRSAVNDPNRYAGPGTGYRLEGDRWQLLQSLPHVVQAADLVAPETPSNSLLQSPGDVLRELGEAAAGGGADEVVIGGGPAFWGGLRGTSNGRPRAE